MIEVLTALRTGDERGLGNRVAPDAEVSARGTARRAVRRLAGAAAVIGAATATFAASAFAAPLPGPVVTRYAGTGTAGAPVNGPALDSPLKMPEGVGVDRHGNIYVTDTQNFRVEKITPDGTLSVIAGDGQQGAATPGPATSSSLTAPGSVAVDAQGDVYISDGNDGLLKVAPDGMLSRFAGGRWPSSPLTTRTMSSRCTPTTTKSGSSPPAVPRR